MPLVIVCAGLVVRVALAKVSETPLAWSDLTSVTVKAAPWAFWAVVKQNGRIPALILGFLLWTMASCAPINLGLASDVGEGPNAKFPLAARR